MNKLRTFIKEKRQTGEDIKIPRIARENDDFSNMKDINDILNSEVLENNGILHTKTVQITEKTSQFRYFLDGIERKKILFYYKSIPCIYGYVAAAVLGRTDKKMHSIGLEKPYEALYLPASHFPDDLGIKITNIQKDEPMLPDQYIFEAHKEIQKVRGELERGMVREWISQNNNDGWLFVDGRVEKLSRELTSGKNIVGIIKSHHACYFDIEQQFKIYSMKKGERSSVFQPQDKQGNKEKVFSWYLRLHYDSKYGTNDFGLIRVEIPADEALIDKADLISNWILLETKPVAFPASRWDRMIYPIKYCEDYLKSKAPSYSRLSL
jgi:hypothetical protein